MPDNDEKCGKCKFWLEIEPATEEYGGIGICRRYPPTADMYHLVICGLLDYFDGSGGVRVRSIQKVQDNNDRFAWPSTEDCDWCGEYKQVEHG